MPAKLSVGIVLQSNSLGGPQKLSAIAAIDLAHRGHDVTIFIPVFPYYFYYMSLRRSPLSWLRAIRPFIGDWKRGRKFVFQDVLDYAGTSGRVAVKFVPRRVSKKDLKGLHCLLIHSADKIAEYRNLLDQDRQIYFFHHPEERAHGHEATFRALRSSFGGKILLSSPFASRQIQDHILDPPMVPASVSPVFWAQRQAFDPTSFRQDILLFVKAETEGAETIDIIENLLKIRPGTTIGAWCRSYRFREWAEREFPNLKVVENPSEKDLCDLYLGYSMLLFPSIYEGFGMPPIEALACGCIPVLRPEVGAAELYARDGENSIFLNGNAADTARRIAGILDSPAVLHPMRVNAPESVLPFDPNGYGQRLLESAGFL